MVKCLFQTDLPAPAVLSTRRVRWGARQRLIKGAESVRGTLSHAREISSSSKLHLTQKGTCTSRGQKNRSVDYHPRHAPGFQKAPSSLALLSNFFWKCRFAFSKGNGRAAGVYTGQIVFFAIGGERQFFCRRCGPRLLIFPSLRLPRSDTTPASPSPPHPADTMAETMTLQQTKSPRAGAFRLSRGSPAFASLSGSNFTAADLRAAPMPALSELGSKVYPKL